MKGFTGGVVLATTLFLAACGGADGDADADTSAAPDVSSETTPPPVPLPPETQPMPADSGPVIGPTSPTDSLAG